MKILKELVSVALSLLLLLFIFGLKIVTWFWDTSPPEIEISEIERRIQ